MMRVVFFDKMRETYVAIEGVIQIESDYVRIDGRITAVWHLHRLEGGMLSYKQRYFSIHRIDI